MPGRLFGQADGRPGRRERFLMSIAATHWAWRQRELLPSEKLTLMALADYADREHAACYPRVKIIAEDAGISESAVHNALKGLEAKGLIEREQRHRDDGSLTSSIYHLHVTLHQASPVSAPPPESESVPTRRVTRITNEFLKRMDDKYRSQLEPDEIREFLAEAVGHTAWLKWTDKQRYVENWIKRALEGRANGRGRAYTERSPSDQPDAHFEPPKAYAVWDQRMKAGEA